MTRFMAQAVNTAPEKSFIAPKVFFRPAGCSGQVLAKLFKIRQSLQICTTNPQGKSMNLSMNIGPIVALIAGILILLIPRLLNYIVAVYLIVIGLIGLFGTGSLRI